MFTRRWSLPATKGVLGRALRMLCDLPQDGPVVPKNGAGTDLVEASPHVQCVTANRFANATGDISGHGRTQKGLTTTKSPYRNTPFVITGYKGTRLTAALGSGGFAQCGFESHRPHLSKVRIHVQVPTSSLRQQKKLVSQKWPAPGWKGVHRIEDTDDSAAFPRVAKQVR
jgi:hypothetical protein